MVSYADRVPPGPRWAIAAYVQALQRAQHVPIANLSQRDAIDPTLKIDSSQPRLMQFQSGEAGGFMESLIELT